MNTCSTSGFKTLRLSSYRYHTCNGVVVLVYNKMTTIVMLITLIQVYEIWNGEYRPGRFPSSFFQMFRKVNEVVKDRDFAGFDGSKIENRTELVQLGF